MPHGSEPDQQPDLDQQRHVDQQPDVGPATRAVLVPVKAFAAAKGRLGPRLDDADRAALARSMAARVLAAAGALPVFVVCDDDDVATWAVAAGASVVRTTPDGLNAAVEVGVAHLDSLGCARVVVAHADLPFATGLERLADAGDDEVVIVPDRRRDGSNVVSVPTGRGFRFSYGPGSFDAHLDEAARCGMRVRVVDSDALGWDVDEPDDLEPPPELGPLPLPVTGS